MTNEPGTEGRREPRPINFQPINFQEFRKALLITLTFGAANADATPEQRKQIRERYKPLADEYEKSGDGRPLIKMLKEVMGPEWQPKGDYLQNIQNILKEKEK